MNSENHIEYETRSFIPCTEHTGKASIHIAQSVRTQNNDLSTVNEKKIKEMVVVSCNLIVNKIKYMIWSCINNPFLQPIDMGTSV